MTSFVQIAAWPLAKAGRARSLAPDRKPQVKYDRHVLHIVEQYPGCHDARVLAFLLTRVQWFGRDTLIDRIFRPSLATVRAAGRRLEAAGKIKITADKSSHRDTLRFYPNNAVWADTDALARLSAAWRS